MDSQKQRKNELYIKDIGFRFLATTISVLAVTFFAVYLRLQDIIARYNASPKTWAEYFHLAMRDMNNHYFAFGILIIFCSFLFYSLYENEFILETDEPVGNLYMVINHNLEQDEAQRRIQNLLKEVKNQFVDKITNLEEKWDGSMGTFKLTTIGYTLSGILTVKESQVELNGNIPFPASVYTGKIKSVIRERAETLLA